MKSGISIVKTIIIVVAFSVVGYVTYKNNKSASDVGSLNDKTEGFDFEQYVDSLCKAIKTLPHSDALVRYDSLYDEIDVYSKIYTNEGDRIIANSVIQNAFTNAFESYWSIFKFEADKLFRRNSWSKRERDELSNEINRLRKRQGVQHVDSLNKYKEYLNGYVSFSNLLDRLESCCSASTYKESENLKNYTGYPYCNLIELQHRRLYAKQSAKNHWGKYLISEKKDISDICNYYLRRSHYVTIAEKESLSKRITDWEVNVKSYKTCTGDSYLIDDEMTSDMYASYQSVLIKFNEQY